MLPQLYLPTPHSNHLCTEVDERGSLHSLKRAEIDLTGDWVNTLSGERYLLGNEGFSNRILIFSKDAMLHLLCDLDTIYVDRTFQVCPSMFMQHFTINGFVHGQQFPLVYVLLPSKTRADYNRMLAYLKEELQNRGLQMSPQSVMADFELAVIQSFEMQLPDIEIQGCLLSSLPD